MTAIALDGRPDPPDKHRKELWVAVVLALILGVVIAWVFLPRDKEIETVTKAVEDTKRVNALIEEMKKMKKASLIEKALGLSSEEKATGGTVGTPEVSPLKPTTMEFTVKRDNGDTVKLPYVTFNHDLIMAGYVRDDEVSFLTFNPYQQAIGVNYVKNYLFPRNTRDFDFTVETPTSATALDGIVFITKRSFLKWDGLFIGGQGVFDGVGKLAATIEGRLTLYERIEFAPGLSSLPMAMFNIRYRL